MKYKIETDLVEIKTNKKDYENIEVYHYKDIKIGDLMILAKRNTGQTHQTIVVKVVDIKDDLYILEDYEKVTLSYDEIKRDK